jgi:hypothetical protein
MMKTAEVSSICNQWVRAIVNFAARASNSVSVNDYSTERPYQTVLVDIK